MSSSSSSSSPCHAMSCHVIMRAYVGRCVMGARIAATARNLRESGPRQTTHARCLCFPSLLEPGVDLAKRRPWRRRLWARAARIRACGVTVRTDVPRKDCGHRAGARRHGQLLGVVERGAVVGHGPSPCKLHGLDPQPTTAQARRPWRSNARIRRC